MSWRSGLVLVLAAAPGCASDAPTLYGETWPEANRLFLEDSRWVGGDGAYSVDLGDGRVLWLFGDSFIALGAERSRSGSRMIRNSVAIQTGYDPATAFMSFYYRFEEELPQSFVPEDGRYWFWPGHGARLGGRLLLFYGRLFQEGEGQWGFGGDTSTAFVVDDPDAEPSAWRLREAVVAPEAARYQLGGAVVREGDWLYVYSTEADTKDIYLLRFEAARAAEGDLTLPEFWTGGGYGAARDAEPVITQGAPEYSVHFAAELGLYLYCETSGFGATTLAIRSAPSPSGPWSEPRDVLRPPEAFEPDAFVYAGKAHPELRGGDLVASYVPSKLEDVPQEIGDALYYPRFARFTFR